MDSSGDGKVSKQEAYDFAGQGMPQADIDQSDMDGFFDDADTNDDGFISFDEFYGAGEEIEGDGKGKFLLKRALKPKIPVSIKSRLRPEDIKKAVQSKLHFASKEKQARR